MAPSVTEPDANTMSPCTTTGPDTSNTLQKSPAPRSGRSWRQTSSPVRRSRARSRRRGSGQLIGTWSKVRSSRKGSPTCTVDSTRSPDTAGEATW